MQASTKRTAAEAASIAAGSSPKERAAAARALLVQCGWDDDRISEPLSVDEFLVLRVAPADEPRLSVVLGRADDTAGSTSLAYSSESELLVHWGMDRITLGQPTQWEVSPGDSPGLSGDAADRWTLEDVFGLLSPERLLSGEPQQVTKLGRAHEALAANLGNALATLRSEAAEAELAAIDQLDREVLRLFHQLLFIRVQEDRGKGRGSRIGDLLSCNASGLPSALAELLDGYREELNSDLFRPSQLTVQKLGAQRLRPLLTALVVPWQELKLNLSLSRADLAGRLYQQYLKRTPALEKAGEGDRPRLIGVAVQRDEQQQTAAYYTPMSVASLLASQTLGTWLAERSLKRPSDIRLVDPSCGSGSFLVAGFKLIREALESGGRTLRPAQREAILRESLFGADIDAKAIEISQLQLLEAANLDRSRLPDLDENLFVGDSLFPPTGDLDLQSGVVPWQAIIDRTGGFDAVLMNPPFFAQLRLGGRLDEGDRQALRERFPDVSGWGLDLAYYFVSLAFALKKEDGCAGMIVPRKLLDGKGGEKTRRLLRSLCPPDRIVDFRGLSLFPGISPQVAMLEFLPGRNQVEALDISDSTIDPALALNTILEDRNGIVRRTRAPRSELGTTWTPFALRWQNHLSKEIGREWQTLGEVDEVVLHQGTQTGNQEALTIRQGSWRRVNADEVEVAGHQIPSRYAPLVAWGREIRPLVSPGEGDRLLFPFEDDKAVTDNPQVGALLAELGGLPNRPQPGAVAKLRQPKVILRGFSREPAAFADLDGRWITVKGTKGGLILVPSQVNEERLEGLAALLCSSLYQWLLRGFGQPRRDETIEIAQGNAEELPWPALPASDWTRLSRVARAVDAALDPDRKSGAARTLDYRDARSHLDELVLDMLEVGPKLRATVASEVVRYL